MAECYMEDLPDDLAKILLEEKYDSNNTYQLITDKEGSYISGRNKLTGEKVDLSVRKDGIPDDYELDVDDFSFVEEELEYREKTRNYTKKFGIWKFVAILITLAWIAALVVGIMIYKGLLTLG